MADEETGFWASIRDTTLGVGQDIWNSSKDDITKLATESIKNSLGIKNQTPAAATPVTYVQAAATNPLTYVFVAGIAILLFVIFGRK